MHLVCYRGKCKYFNFYFQFFFFDLESVNILPFLGLILYTSAVSVRENTSHNCLYKEQRNADRPQRVHGLVCLCSTAVIMVITLLLFTPFVLTIIIVKAGSPKIQAHHTWKIHSFSLITHMHRL